MADTANSADTADAAAGVEDLLIIGAGGFARETAAAVSAINTVHPTWRLLGFLDDDPQLHGEERDGVRVLGGTDLAEKLPEARVVICVGNPRGYRARARLVERLGLPESRYATVIHPSAQIAESCAIGPGSVILALVTLTASVAVGAHVAVMPQVVLTHDVVVADYATLASGVVLGGGVRVERGAYLGAGALIREQVVVGAWAQVGMGSMVLRDVPAAEVWVGSPARYLRPAESDARASAQATAQAHVHAAAQAGPHANGEHR
jgi:sugar O-acyltransferase (sialic acid O-acetyltransferase NeuD family)